MPKSVFTGQYDYFRELLVKAREDAGYSQAQLAARLKKPQSYVSKYERGERRLDVIEFLEIAEILKIDVESFIQKLKNRMRRIRSAD